jgi:serine/threonine-protein kinase
MIGKIIGNYQITGELAQGGMGAVYRGRHLHLPREVVVKSILLGAFSASAQTHLKARFRREAFVQSQLDHPNIVRVYEFFAAEENYYLVMEYVQGMTLRDLLARQGTPTPAQAVYLLKQALASLDYAHNFGYLDESDHQHSGVIHRDVKPANMLLDTKGRLKITDFGIVKVMGEQTGLGMTQSGFHPGTVEYMSPEQLLGLQIDERSDLYSLGVTFYEMLTGRLPFQRSATGSDWEIRKGHIELDPPPIQEIRPDIHPQLAAIIARSLQKNPNERFQSATKFLEAVRAYEQSNAQTEQTLRSPADRMTQPLAMKPTLIDESATLLARESTPPRKSSVEDQVTIPLGSSQVSLAPPSSSGAPAPATSGIEAISSDPVLTNVLKITPPPSQPVQSGRKWLLAAGGAGLLLAGGAVGAMLFSQRQSEQLAPQTTVVKVEPSAPIPSPSLSTLATPATPAPSPSASVAAKPKPSAAPAERPVEKSSLKLAQKFEQQEQYDEAIKAYEEHLARSPNSLDAAAITSYLNELRKVQAALTVADTAMGKQFYQVAVRQYTRALQLRPTSARAKQGMEEAAEKLKTMPSPGAKRGFPFDQSEFPPGRGRQDQPGQTGPRRRTPPEQPNQSQPPDDQPIPPRSQRRNNRPIPQP